MPKPQDSAENPESPPPPPKHPGGRPTKYTRDLALLICERTTEGKSLVRICQEDGMPGVRTVLDWLAREDEPFKEFSQMYARAKQEMAEFLAEEILEIADDGTNDFKTIVKDGREVDVVDQEHIQRSRLRVDTRKWIASKLKPKKYGEKLDLEHSGAVSTGVPAEVKLAEYLKANPKAKEQVKEMLKVLKHGT